MSVEDIGEWCDRNRVMLSLILIALVWSSLFFLFWSKGKELTTNPCSLCAEKIGRDITCRADIIDVGNIIFYENGSIKQPERKDVTDLLQKGKLIKD